MIGKVPTDGKRRWPLILPAALLFLAAAVAIAWVLGGQLPGGESAESRPRHLGYGISVAPHLPSRPDLLNEMGMDWVKIYDTVQFADYPNQKILYRTEVRRLPDEAWDRGLVDLAHQLVAQGVDAVEIGNEPNLGPEWETGPPNPEEYTQALCRGYAAIKSAEPGLIIVAGGLAPTAGTADGLNMDDFEFARRMFNAGAGRCFDAFAYHPYGFNQPPEADPYANPFSFRRTELMYQLMLDYGIMDKQIWITEFGWVRNPAEDGVDCSTAPEFAGFNWMVFPADVQADYTARALSFADKNWPWVGPMFLWNLNWNEYTDTGYEPQCSHMRWYGLTRQDGSRLPVFYAVQGVEKRVPFEYRPIVGAVVHQMTATIEAGCGGYMPIGSFSIVNRGYPGQLIVSVEPMNGPGRPVVGVSTDTASSGDKVEVYIDATDATPGLHMIAVNLKAAGGERISSLVVQGWLFVTYPTQPECIARYQGETG